MVAFYVINNPLHVIAERIKGSVKGENLLMHIVLTVEFWTG